MVHALESNEIKQVEFNTIASSFAGISSHFRPLHRYRTTIIKHTQNNNHFGWKSKQPQHSYYFINICSWFCALFCYSVNCFCLILTSFKIWSHWGCPNIQSFSCCCVYFRNFFLLFYFWVFLGFYSNWTHINLRQNDNWSLH